MTGLKFVLALAAALITGTFFMLRAEATPLTGAVDSLAVLKTYSQLQQAGLCFRHEPLPRGHQMGVPQVVCDCGRCQEMLVSALLISAGASFAAEI